MYDLVKKKSENKELDVLKGPPGVLFGLTLLVFLFARLYLVWVPDVKLDASSPSYSPVSHR